MFCNAIFNFFMLLVVCIYFLLPFPHCSRSIFRVIFRNHYHGAVLVSCYYVTLGCRPYLELSNIMPDIICYDIMVLGELVFFIESDNHCLPEDIRDGFNHNITPLGLGKPDYQTKADGIDKLSVR